MDKDFEIGLLAYCQYMVVFGQMWCWWRHKFLAQYRIDLHFDRVCIDVGLGRKFVEMDN